MIETLSYFLLPPAFFPDLPHWSATTGLNCLTLPFWAVKRTTARRLAFVAEKSGSELISSPYFLPPFKDRLRPVPPPRRLVM